MFGLKNIIRFRFIIISSVYYCFNNLFSFQFHQLDIQLNSNGCLSNGNLSEFQKSSLTFLTQQNNSTFVILK